MDARTVAEVEAQSLRRIACVLRAEAQELPVWSDLKWRLLETADRTDDEAGYPMRPPALRLVP